MPSPPVRVVCCSPRPPRPARCSPRCSPPAAGRSRPWRPTGRRSRPRTWSTIRDGRRPAGRRDRPRHTVHLRVGCSWLACRRGDTSTRHRRGDRTGHGRRGTARNPQDQPRGCRTLSRRRGGDAGRSVAGTARVGSPHPGDHDERARHLMQRTARTSRWALGVSILTALGVVVGAPDDPAVVRALPAVSGVSLDSTPTEPERAIGGTSPSVSGDGRIVAFVGPPQSRTDERQTTAYLRDRASRLLLEATPSAAGMRLGETAAAVVSSDGCSLTVLTQLPLNLFSDDDLGDRWDVYRAPLPGARSRVSAPVSTGNSSPPTPRARRSTRSTPSPASRCPPPAPSSPTWRPSPASPISAV